MILRITTKLGKKIHITPAISLPLASNPLVDWSATLFTADRTQCVLFSNSASLYSAVSYGKGITDDSLFIKRAMSAIADVLEDDGYDFIYQRLIAPSNRTVQFSKALNRSVTGSMNDLVNHAKFNLIERQLSPFDVADRLNRIPMGALDYAHPREAFAKLVLSGSGEGHTTN